VWAFVLLIKYMCGLLSSFLKISVWGFVLWAFVLLDTFYMDYAVL